MLRSVGLFESEALDDRSRRQFPVPQSLNNGDPSGVCQSLKYIGFKLPECVEVQVITMALVSYIRNSEYTY